MKDEIKPTILIIVGKPRHGKDTLAEAVALETQWKRGACSDVIYESIAKSMLERMLSDIESTGVHRPVWGRCSTLLPKITEGLKSVEKETLRPILIARGDALGHACPDYMVASLVLGGCRIITGVRRRREFETVKRRLSQDYNPVFVWVERLGFEGPKDNLELIAEDCDVRVSFPEGVQPFVTDSLRDKL